MRRTVEQGERLVVRRDGRVLAVLGPGRHRLPGRAWRRRVQRVDVRERLLLVSGQEVSTVDVPGVKVSLVVRWQVADPVAWLDVSAEPVEELRVQVQLALRDWAGTRGVEEVVAERGAATAELTAAVAAATAATGTGVTSVTVRDVVVPVELRRAALALAAARAEGLAELERARAETAALRSRANGARLLSEHPALLHLRAIETAAERGRTVVLKPPSWGRRSESAVGGAPRRRSRGRIEVVVIRSHVAAATAATMRGDVDLRGRAAVDAFVDATTRLLSQPFRRSHVRVHPSCVRAGPTTDAPCACTARRGSTTGAGPYETVQPL